jgi:hypothetical protein
MAAGSHGGPLYRGGIWGGGGLWILFGPVHSIVLILLGIRWTVVVLLIY